MNDTKPGEEQSSHGPISRALSTSVRGNSPAFGFSITITASFGVVNQVAGSPSVMEMLLFGLGAASAVAGLEGMVSRGFRARAAAAPSEVRLLATSMNIVSVGAGVGTAIGAVEAIGGGAGWPVAGFAAAAVYVLTEASEVMLAERIQAARGDPRAHQETEED